MDLSKTPILIVGEGAEARLAIDIANSIEVLVFGLLRTDEPKEGQEDLKEINDIPIVAQLGDEVSISLLKEQNVHIVVAEPDSLTRKVLFRQVRMETDRVGINLFHPSIVTSPYAKIGGGNIACAYTQFQANAQVGNFNYFNGGVVVEADVIIGDYCTFQSGVVVGKGAEIADLVSIGQGAVIFPGVYVGEGAIVAAGSVVMRDVEADTTVFGNPAKAV